MTWAGTWWSPRPSWSRSPTGPIFGRRGGRSRQWRSRSPRSWSPASSSPTTPSSSSSSSRSESGRRLRFWQPGTVVGILLVASVAIPFTENDQGPFSGVAPDDRLLLAQGFLGIASITMLVLSAVITERRRAEEAVKSIAGTLQESLLPTHLPVIPGIETAVDFRAAGKDAPRWRRLLRPVPGRRRKLDGDRRRRARQGADGGGDQRLARYTLRAAAVQESQPSRILRLLNDAIRRQSPDQSCTVACGRIDLTPQNGARVTLAVGGPPVAAGPARERPGRAGRAARDHARRAARSQAGRPHAPSSPPGIRSSSTPMA